MKKTKSAVHPLHYSHKNDLKVLAVLIILLLAGWALFFMEYNSKHELHPYNVTTKSYECPDEKTIVAAFSGNIVNLDLSDGRNIVLNHPLKDDSKYTNKDDSMVFWTRDKKAYIREGNIESYSNCEQK